MKKYYNFLLLAISMFVVACNTVYEDPFLGNNIVHSEKENRKNIEAFRNSLTTGSLLQWNSYVKEPDGKWEFENYKGLTGVPIKGFIMLDENTRLCMSGNIRTSCDDTPFYPHLFSKYNIAYNYSSGEIQTTEICTVGSFGETFSCNLCRSKNGVFICEGQLVGDEIYHNTPNGLVKFEVRWCFEGRDDRERIIEAYEQWLDEQ